MKSGLKFNLKYKNPDEKPETFRKNDLPDSAGTHPFPKMTGFD
jgi:hypothetical protein